MGTIQVLEMVPIVWMSIRAPSMQRYMLNSVSAKTGGYTFFSFLDRIIFKHIYGDRF